MNPTYFFLDLRNRQQHTCCRKVGLSYNQLVISCFLISILFLDFIDRVSTRSCGGKGIVDDGKGRKKFLISGYITEITCVVHYSTYKKMTARGKSLAVIISCCEITSEK